MPEKLLAATMSKLQRYRNVLCIVFVAFAARLFVRCYSGAEEFWANSYFFFFKLAQNIAMGDGIASYRVPLYPAFLAAVTFGHQVFLPIAVSQSLVGAGTVLCAALIAEHMFGG